MNIFEILKQIYEWVSANPSGATIVFQGIPIVVRQIDSWISTAKYEDAKKKVHEIKTYDLTRLHEIYTTRKGDMSKGVERAFREELERQGMI